MREQQCCAVTRVEMQVQLQTWLAVPVSRALRGVFQAQPAWCKPGIIALRGLMHQDHSAKHVGSL